MVLCKELADTLAKEAIREDRDMQMAIPILEFRNLWQDQHYQNLLRWTTDEAETRSAFYYQNFISDSRYTWFRKFNIIEFN